LPERLGGKHIVEQSQIERLHGIAPAVPPPLEWR
jgi:hypothetical protein